MVIDLIMLSVFFGGWGLILVMAYKNRERLKKWMDTPSIKERPTRKIYLQRKIEDYQAELNEIENAERGEYE